MVMGQSLINRGNPLWLGKSLPPGIATRVLGLVFVHDIEEEIDRHAPVPILRNLQGTSAENWRQSMP